MTFYASQCLIFNFPWFGVLSCKIIRSNKLKKEKESKEEYILSKGLHCIKSGSHLSFCLLLKKAKIAHSMTSYGS